MIGNINFFWETNGPKGTIKYGRTRACKSVNYKKFTPHFFSYLIGVHDLPIISEMLGRRVSKLKIEHDNRSIEADYGTLMALAQASLSNIALL